MTGMQLGMRDYMLSRSTAGKAGQQDSRGNW